MLTLKRNAVMERWRGLASDLAAVDTRIRSSLADGPKLLRFLLVSDSQAYTSEQQFAPMFRHAAALRRQHGVVFERMSLERARALSRSSLLSSDVVGLKLSFRTPAAEAVQIARHFKTLVADSTTRLVYFDGDDDVCVQWNDVLKNVDLYVKKHVFADSNAYLRRYAGKSNLTDFVVREHGRSFDDDIIPSSGPCDAAELPKLHLGWNIGLDDKIEELARTITPPKPEDKDIDIGSRAFVRPEVWIHPLRDPVVDRIDALSGRFRVLAPRERATQAQYYQELLRARICVSPFGYGELCWRDFEAVLCGCLLVKPDMAHVKTYPNIFVAGETFAPVAWDYSDLEAVCARYLGDEPARRRIAERAREVLLAALRESEFVAVFGELLGRLGLGAPARLANAP